MSKLYQIHCSCPLRQVDKSYISFIILAYLTGKGGQNERNPGADLNVLLSSWLV